MDLTADHIYAILDELPDVPDPFNGSTIVYCSQEFFDAIPTPEPDAIFKLPMPRFEVRNYMEPWTAVGFLKGEIRFICTKGEND